MGVSDDYEDKREIALQLLMQVKALTTCLIHDDEIIDGWNDPVPAYKLAMAKYTRGEYPQFENAREFTDYLKEIYEEYADGECGACTKALDF